MNRVVRLIVLLALSSLATLNAALAGSASISSKVLMLPICSCAPRRGLFRGLCPDLRQMRVIPGCGCPAERLYVSDDRYPHQEVN
jgi:hypothetical protein